MVVKIEELIEKLGHQDEDIRRGAARALGDMGEDAKDAVSVLIQALQDQDRSVRRSAAKALEEIGTLEALKAAEEHKKSRIMRGY